MFGRKKREREERFQREALPHLDTLYRGAFYLTKSKAAADDLVQDTYLKGLKSFDSFREGTNCKAWLYRIMTNTFLNNRRKAKRVDSFVDQNAPGDSEAYWNDPQSLARMDPEASFLSQTMSPAVKKALLDIPEDFRAAVVLCDLQDFSYREIGEILGVPTGTVMSRIHRGRKLLKDRLIRHAVETGILPQPSATGDDAPTSLDSYRASRGGK